MWLLRTRFLVNSPRVPTCNFSTGTRAIEPASDFKGLPQAISG